MPTMLDWPIRMNTLTGFDISAGFPAGASPRSGCGASVLGGSCAATRRKLPITIAASMHSRSSLMHLLIMGKLLSRLSAYPKTRSPLPFSRGEGQG